MASSSGIRLASLAMLGASLNVGMPQGFSLHPQPRKKRNGPKKRKQHVPKSGGQGGRKQ